MVEEWKQAKLVDSRIDERYYVSNLGRAKSMYRYNGKIKDKMILKPKVDNRGYVNLTLMVNHKKRSYRLHRLVALLFIPNTLNKPQINHKDGNKLNNCINNLEWVTAKENVAHAFRTGLTKSERAVIKLKDGVEIARYKSLAQASRENGISSSNLCALLTGAKPYMKTLGGYEWKYETRQHGYVN